MRTMWSIFKLNTFCWSKHCYRVQVLSYLCRPVVVTRIIIYWYVRQWANIRIFQLISLLIVLRSKVGIHFILFLSSWIASDVMTYTINRNIQTWWMNSVESQLLFEAILMFFFHTFDLEYCGFAVEKFLFILIWKKYDMLIGWTIGFKKENYNLLTWNSIRLYLYRHTMCSVHLALLFCRSVSLSLCFSPRSSLFLNWISFQANEINRVWCQN